MNNLEVKFLNMPKIICLHRVKWFKALLSNTKNSIYNQSSVCTQLDSFKSNEVIKYSISPIDRTLTGTKTLGQSGPESNGIEGVFQILQSSSSGVSVSDGV